MVILENDINCYDDFVVVDCDEKLLSDKGYLG